MIAWLFLPEYFAIRRASTILFYFITYNTFLASNWIIYLFQIGKQKVLWIIRILITDKNFSWRRMARNSTLDFDDIMLFKALQLFIYLSTYMTFLWYFLLNCWEPQVLSWAGEMHRIYVALPSKDHFKHQSTWSSDGIIWRYLNTFTFQTYCIKKGWVWRESKVLI